MIDEENKVREMKWEKEKFLGASFSLCLFFSHRVDQLGGVSASS